jgi:hypothetical protein
MLALVRPGAQDEVCGLSLRRAALDSLVVAARFASFVKKVWHHWVAYHMVARVRNCSKRAAYHTVARLVPRSPACIHCGRGDVRGKGRCCWALR